MVFVDNGDFPSHSVCAVEQSVAVPIVLLFLFDANGIRVAAVNAPALVINR